MTMSSPRPVRLVLVLLFAGCAAAENPAANLETELADSSGVKVLTIRQPLDFRKFQPIASQLRPDLTLGGDAQLFGHIADVAVLPDGRFAVLDRAEFRVTLFSSDGEEIRKFGRKGKGPGEFADPYGIAAFGNRLVVREARSTTPLILFDTAGNYVATATNVPEGDWKAHYDRALIARTTDAPYRMPAEDLTTRLLPLGSTDFAFVLQPPTNPGSAANESALSAFVIRFDSAGRSSDTLDAAPALEDQIDPYRRGARADIAGQS